MNQYLTIALLCLGFVDDAVKVNFTQLTLSSVLKIYLHDVLVHAVFLISSFGANTGPFCLSPTA